MLHTVCIDPLCITCLQYSATPEVHMFMLLLLTACGNGEPELAPLTVEFLDGYFGLVDAGNEVAECDPAEACEEDVDFVIVDASGGTVVATISHKLEIVDMVFSYGSPYAIVSGGTGDRIEDPSAVVDNTDYEWVEGIELVQPELCDPAKDPDCTQMVEEE